MFNVSIRFAYRGRGEVEHTQRLAFQNTRNFLPRLHYTTDSALYLFNLFKLTHNRLRRLGIHLYLDAWCPLIRAQHFLKFLQQPYQYVLNLLQTVISSKADSRPHIERDEF